MLCHEYTGLNLLFQVILWSIQIMSIEPVLYKVPLKSLDKKVHDLNYWLAQPVIKRLEAVIFLILQTVDLKNTRMDKSNVVRRKLK